MSAKVDTLRRRDALLQAVRDFFGGHGFIEVTTPVVLAAPALEDYIDAIPVASGGWLRTSPELQMKQLVAAGHSRIFQLGPCFRAGEHGRRHREEFTMLEWYQAGADYSDLIPFTDALVRHAAAAVDSPLDLQAQEVLGVAEAFHRIAGVSVQEVLAADRFEEVLVDAVEPGLPQDRPVFLRDYPAAHAALARRQPGNPNLAERWELYLGGLELANAYSELTDPVEQRRRFEATAARRAAAGRAVYPIDEAFLAALAHLPPTAGCALGVDRLLMALLQVSDIADVRAE